jgi:hypothetical protein
MPETPENDPVEKGEAHAVSRCDVCGAVGDTVLVPDRPPPSRFCLRCVVEYGDQAGGGYDDD